MSNYPNIQAKIDAQPERAKWNKDASDEIVRNGFTEADLTLAFNAVRDMENWKYPIEAYFPKGLTDDEHKLIDQAVTYFTGSIVQFFPHPSAFVVAVADGYYLAIGA